MNVPELVDTADALLLNWLKVLCSVHEPFVSNLRQISPSISPLHNKMDPLWSTIEEVEILSVMSSTLSLFKPPATIIEDILAEKLK